MNPAAPVIKHFIAANPNSETGEKGEVRLHRERQNRIRPDIINF
jgi:hypothetical protein